MPRPSPSFQGYLPAGDNSAGYLSLCRTPRARFGVAISTAWFQDAFHTLWFPARDTHFTRHHREWSFKGDFLQACPDKSPFACINPAQSLRKARQWQRGPPQSSASITRSSLLIPKGALTALIHQYCSSAARTKKAISFPRGRQGADAL